MSFPTEWVQQLNALSRKVGDPDFATYVIKACQVRRAFLFSATDGWVVVAPKPEPMPHLFVLAAYCTGHNAIERYEPFIMQLAGMAGLSTIRFEAARKAYARIMPARGWRVLADGRTWEKNRE